MLPKFGSMKLDVSRAGECYAVEEEDRSVRRVDTGGVPGP